LDDTAAMGEEFRGRERKQMNRALYNGETEKVRDLA
jgi:hypothetical protein